MTSIIFWGDYHASHSENEHKLTIFIKDEDLMQLNDIFGKKLSPELNEQLITCFNLCLDLVKNICNIKSPNNAQQLYISAKKIIKNFERFKINNSLNPHVILILEGGLDCGFLKDPYYPDFFLDVKQSPNHTKV